jgi:methylated-DNA-protein-cysteine methyltransferase related protein
MSKKYEKVYDLVSKIPRGKVTTYGEIGKALKMSPRVVGNVLHLNPYGPEVPCHRVVNREGRVAPNYAFGGHDEQKKRLEREGVMFKDDLHIADLDSRLLKI